MTSKVQKVGDGFHALEHDIDQLLSRLAAQTAAAIDVRNQAGISGFDSQRTLAKLGAAQTALLECRGNVTSAHVSAEKDAEAAGLPWECPPGASAQAEPSPLKVVNS